MQRNCHNFFKDRIYKRHLVPHMIRFQWYTIDHMRTKWPTKGKTTQWIFDIKGRLSFYHSVTSKFVIIGFNFLDIWEEDWSGFHFIHTYVYSFSLYTYVPALIYGLQLTINTRYMQVLITVGLKGYLCLSSKGFNKKSGQMSRKQCSLTLHTWCIS